MKIKKIPISTVLTIFFTGVILVSACIFYFFTNNNLPAVPLGSFQKNVTHTVEAADTSGSWLKIEAINVNAKIESVGLTKSGAMSAPKDITHVAWYSRGVRPGEIGSAVIAGHYGWKNNKKAAFDSLHRLKKGDTVVVNDKGVVSTFVVKKIKKYDPKSDTNEIFISNDGKSHLNLITCGGVWDSLAKSYSERLVVFTDKVSRR